MGVFRRIDSDSYWQHMQAADRLERTAAEYDRKTGNILRGLAGTFRERATLLVLGEGNNIAMDGGGHLASAGKFKTENSPNKRNAASS